MKEKWKKIKQKHFLCESHKEKMSIINAYTEDGKVVNIKDYKPEYKGKLKCCQGHEVCARKGVKMIHHYAHKKRDGSCECSREMGEWHIKSQERIKEKYLEVRIKDESKYHIADVLTDDGIVIEYQKSVISPKIIKAREMFYGKMCRDMVWIICAENMDIKIKKQCGEYVKLKYLKGNKYFKYCKKKVFLDQNKKGYIEIIDMKNNIGKLISYKYFDDKYLNGCLKPGADTRMGHHGYQINEIIPLDEALESLRG